MRNLARLKGSGAGAMVLWAVAFWPVLSWWWARTADSSDDALGLVAVALLVVVTAQERRRAPRLGMIGAALIVAYAASFAWAPNLVRGLFAAAVLGVVVGRARGTGAGHFGTWGLVAMTLPMLASLRFFLGYPLRWLTTQITAALLRLGGMMVEVRGLALVMGPVEVWVDGPCSGVQMLWVGVFLAAALAFVFRLRNAATIALFLLSLVATVVGNIWRASGVFYMESGLIDAPDVFHDLVGMGAFAVVAVGVAAAGWALRRFAVPAEALEPAPVSAAVSAMGSRRERLAVVLAAAAAAVVPMITPASSGGAAKVDFPGWPNTLEGTPLKPRELSERDKPYLAGFPGRIAAFHAGDEEVLVRWVTRETRRLHSAADCYRGLGYDVEPVQPRYPGYVSFRVTRNGESMWVSERISERFDDAGGTPGESFGEVGDWYWSAKLGSTVGPWWSVVRVERVR